MSIRMLPLALLLAVTGTARAKMTPGDRAIDFEKPSLSGATVKLSALRGKVVLVDFWASWCEPCKRELPLLAKMASRLRPKGVEIVTVNIDDRTEAAQAFLRQHDLQLTVVADVDKKLVATYDPPKMPSSFVVDKAGIVRAINGGFEDGDAARIEQQLLALAAR
jgi:thiol-disulfide isomerase/thioredoxin